MESKKRHSIYIIGGGPSLQGFDFTLLQDQTTMGINHAAEHVSYLNYFLSADTGVIDKAARNQFWNMHDATTKIAVVGPEHKNYRRCKDSLQFYDHVVRPARFDGEVSFVWEGFATGRNSGFCGMQYAILQEYKDIYLMGFDLKPSSDKRHFFDPSRPHAPQRELGRDLKNFLKHFATAFKILKDTDVKVVSLSPDSLLNDHIPYMKFEETL